MHEVVITGVGMITALDTPEHRTWNNLLCGTSGIRPLTRARPLPGRTPAAGEVAALDSRPQADERYEDPFVWLAQQATREALCDAGLSEEALAEQRVGIVVGCSVFGITRLQHAVSAFLRHGPQAVAPGTIPGVMSNAPAAAIATMVKASGPVLTVNTGCASGADAIGLARTLIQTGMVTMAIAGGVDAPLSDWVLPGFHALRVLATDAFPPEASCRPWDAQRTGTVIGEGAGMCVLERRRAAQARHQDGSTTILAYTSLCTPRSPIVPDAQTMARGLDMTLAGQRRPAALCLHGTGTRAGDAAEMTAVAQQFGQHAPAVAAWASKGALGHCLGAASAIDIACAVLSLRTGWIPPTRNFATPDGAAPALQIAPQAWRACPTTILTMAMGFGGHQAYLLLGDIHAQ